MSESSSQGCLLNVDQIRAFLPHRAPFLFVDRILEMSYPEPAPAETRENGFWAPVGTRVVGLKNVTINEPFFQGHFLNFQLCLESLF